MELEPLQFEGLQRRSAEDASLGLDFDVITLLAKFDLKATGDNPTDNHGHE